VRCKPRARAVHRTRSLQPVPPDPKEEVEAEAEAETEVEERLVGDGGGWVAWQGCSPRTQASDSEVDGWESCASDDDHGGSDGESHGERARSVAREQQQYADDRPSTEMMRGLPVSALDTTYSWVSQLATQAPAGLAHGDDGSGATQSTGTQTQVHTIPIRSASMHVHGLMNVWLKCSPCGGGLSVCLQPPAPHEHERLAHEPLAGTRERNVSTPQ
jgi:hypothetical protein